MGVTLWTHLLQLQGAGSGDPGTLGWWGWGVKGLWEQQGEGQRGVTPRRSLGQSHAASSADKETSVPSLPHIVANYILARLQ